MIFPVSWNSSFTRTSSMSRTLCMLKPRWSIMIAIIKLSTQVASWDGSFIRGLGSSNFSILMLVKSALLAIIIFIFCALSISLVFYNFCQLICRTLQISACTTIAISLYPSSRLKHLCFWKCHLQLQEPSQASQGIAASEANPESRSLEEPQYQVSLNNATLPGRSQITEERRTHPHGSQPLKRHQKELQLEAHLSQASRMFSSFLLCFVRHHFAFASQIVYIKILNFVCRLYHMELSKY